MKKLIFLLVIAVLLGAMAVTNPDKTQHQQSIKRVVAGAIDHEIDRYVPDDAAMLGFFGSAVAARLVDKYLDSELQVDNYFLLSVGTITLGEKEHTVSVGLFGHVFTFDESDLKTALQERLETLLP